MILALTLTKTFRSTKPLVALTLKTLLKTFWGWSRIAGSSSLQLCVFGEGTKGVTTLHRTRAAHSRRTRTHTHMEQRATETGGTSCAKQQQQQQQREREHTQMRAALSRRRRVFFLPVAGAQELGLVDQAIRVPVGLGKLADQQRTVVRVHAPQTPVTHRRWISGNLGKLLTSPTIDMHYPRIQ
jgi:hypothetical protein